MGNAAEKQVLRCAQDDKSLKQVVHSAQDDILKKEEVHCGHDDKSLKPLVPCVQDGKSLKGERRQRTLNVELLAQAWGEAGSCFGLLLRAI